MLKKIPMICSILLVANSAMVNAGQINVIVNSDLPIGSLSADDIRQIYLAKRTTFPSGEPVVPLDSYESGDLYQQFYKGVVRKTAGQISAYWSRLLFSGKGSPPQQLVERQDILNKVAGNPRFIAYVDGAVSSDKVKVVYTITVP